MEKITSLIKQFGHEKRWVTWKYKVLKGKKTKIPYAVSGRMASSTNPETWATHKEVFAANPDKVGIVFTPAMDLLGIDIDHCLKDKKIEHEQKERIADLILEADTYTEISPSGEGLHLFVRVPAGFALDGNKHAPFEIYSVGRYFTVTGNVYGEDREVRSVTDDEARRLLGIIGYPWKDNETDSSVNSSNQTLPIATTLDDATILEKMFASKNGAKVKKLYDGDLGDHKNDHSIADLSLCSHLAFWTGRDPVQMERIWMASPLGNRAKTQKRQQYRSDTIDKAIKSCTEIYTPNTTKKNAQDPKLDLLFTLSKGEGKIYTQNTENMSRILKRHSDFEGRFRYDSFKNTLEYRPQKTNKWRTLEDGEVIDIQTQIQVLFPCFGRVGKDMIFDAIIKASRDNTIDSAMEYMTSLKWDGTARLDTWLGKTFGTPNDIYHIAVASNWIKGSVKRIMEPGCKFDYVLVLEGPQGSRKSTSLSILGGDWHVETTMSTDNKDFFMQFAGKVFIEFSEGETMSRTEVKKMKAIITTQVDRYRQPWGKTSQDFPRRCVFAMTTNQTEYLKDETGNRRWLPITVVFPEADTDWLQTNREQLFAEAFYRLYTKKETIYEFPKEETLAAQDARKIKDANTDAIGEWYHGKLTQNDRNQGITIFQVYRDALHGGYNTKPLDKYNEMNIAEVLRSHLKLEKRRTMIEGNQSTRWYEKGAPVLVEDTTYKELEENF